MDTIVHTVERELATLHIVEYGEVYRFVITNKATKSTMKGPPVADIADCVVTAMFRLKVYENTINAQQRKGATE